MADTVVVCSGGLDSVTLAHMVARDRRLARLITFDYGQRHRREIESAAKVGVDLGVPHDVIDIRAVTPFLQGSALTDPDNAEVPDGHYAEETMRVTVVPNRNAIMLTIAFGVAAGTGATRVAAAMHGGDHFIYPDCRPAFVDAFARMQDRALDEMWSVALHTPFVGISKAGIVCIGDRLGVPYADTWSCYRGGEVHCGRCGTCVERREAFALAGVVDPTVYEDPDYWRQAVANAPRTA